MLGFGFGDSSVFIYDETKPIGFAITITVFCVLSFVGIWFFKDRPESGIPPSLSQA
jgi:hypothetical protein